MVHVGIFRVSGVNGGLEKGLLEWQPVGFLETAHRDRTVRAVKIIANVGIGFQLSEIGQHVHVCPLIVTHGRPGVVIFGNATQQHLAVNRAGAADYFAPGNRHGLGLLGTTPGLE